jgi:hypothetical protein
MKMIKISVSFNFWLWLCRFAYKRLTYKLDREPVGIPARRDPDSVCEAYSPRKRNEGEWNGCQTDGHYLCKECALIDEEKLIEYQI